MGGGLLLTLPEGASATLENVSPSALFAQTPVVTFAGVPLAGYADVPFEFGSGPYTGSFMVFGSAFVGQTLLFSGAAPFSQVNIGEASAPGQSLQLEAGLDDYVEVTDDAASPTNPVLAGGPVTFREPVSILLTEPTSAIALTVGYLDSLDTLTIDAYDASGNEIGAVTNTATGFETFGLLDPNGVAISGLTIQSTDPAGFDINDIYLATNMPEPATLATLVLGLIGLSVARRSGTARGSA
jgi:hypothetical protein